MKTVSDRLAETNWDDKLSPELLLEALRQTDGPDSDMDCQIHMLLQPDMPYTYRYNEWWVDLELPARVSYYASYTNDFEKAVAILKSHIVGWKWNKVEWVLENVDGQYRVTFKDPTNYTATHSNMAIAFCMCVVQLARDLQP